MPRLTPTFSVETVPNAQELRETPCLVPCAIDEDQYFEVTRAIANRVGCAPPSHLHIKHLSGIESMGSKMSSSARSTTILVSDTPEEIMEKLKHQGLAGSQQASKSGMKSTAGLQDLEHNVCYEYLRFFLEVRK